MKNLIIIILCAILLTAFVNSNNTPTQPNIMYKGNIYYFCGTASTTDTLITPDGSLQIFYSYKRVYNHFGCDNVIIYDDQN
jgi:hypothetical protein